jgi:hypothetical protein
MKKYIFSLLLTTFFVGSSYQVFSQNEKAPLLSAKEYELLFGKWVSSEDKNSIIIIQKPNVFISVYGKDVADKGTFKIQKVGNGKEAYIEFIVEDPQVGILEYELLGVSEKNLSFMYLDRGNILSYNRKK